MTPGRPGSVGMVLCSKVLGELISLYQCTVCVTQVRFGRVGAGKGG